MKPSTTVALSAVAALLLLLTTMVWPAGAEPGADALITTLRTHAKLHAPDSILDDFVKGKPETGVIIHLKPTAAAETLAAQSKMSGKAPRDFTAAGAPPYYDLHDESVKSQLRATVTEHVGRVIDQLGPPGMMVTRKFSYQFGYAARVTPAALERIANSPDVLLVEKDAILKPHLAQGIPLMNAIAPRTTYTGAGVSIAICDTGIDTSHTALGGGGFPNAKVIGGYDTGDNNADPRPGAGGEAHGTACAGIAAGYTGTVGDYIGGVAPGARLYAVKISTDADPGSATTSAMIAGWEWAVTHKNDDPNNPILIISTSFGGAGYTTACDSVSTGMTTAAANAVAAGITIFASSGNEGYCGSIAWPACISYVNSVGAVYDANIGRNPPTGYVGCISSSSCGGYSCTTCGTGYKCYVDSVTGADQVTTYSNSASFLTLFAPSNNAYTTDIVGSGGYSSGDYTTDFGGTSAACPYAAGTAALLQQAAKARTGSYLTPAQVRSYLVENGDSVTDSKFAITKPRINLGRAVDALPAPGPDFTLAAAPTTVTVAPGGTGSTAVTTTVSGGFSSDVTLSATGLPSGVTASFAPATIVAPGAGTSLLTLTASPETSAGSSTVTVSATGGGVTRTVDLTLVISSLSAALDTTRPVTTGGNAAWYPQTATTHDGSDAARAGAIGNSQSSWMETTATGPGTVSFWWKVSSQSGGDFLRFYLDGVEKNAISGTVDWTQVSQTLISGAHTLRWEYKKNTRTSSGSDTGWVDQLVVPQTTYTVTTSAGSGGSITPTATVDSGSSFTVVVTPATGYHIATVEVDGVSQTVADPKSYRTTFTNVTANHTVSATFAVDMYTVTFNSNGGSAVNSQSVPYNTMATEPSTPTRSGSTFAGWYSDSGLTTSFNFSTPITANLTLFAKWLPVATRTNVALAANGGTAAASSAGSYPAAKVNDGSRVPATSNYWRDTTYNSWPDSVMVTFRSLSSISEIDVITTPNDLTSTTEPTAGVTTFTANGITAYDVQYCSDQTAGYTTTCPVSGTGTNWVTLQSVTAADPRLVWRTFTFPAVTTQRIRMVVTASLNYNSRIVEIEAYTDSGTPVNTPPTVTLTAPASGTTYTAPATITLTATATDPDGTVSNVEFYNGATLLGAGTLSAGVYSHTWSGVAAGSYSLTAVATDNGGASTTSSAVTLTVDPATVCTAATPTLIVAPTTASVIAGGSAAVYTVTLINNDSAACSSTSFTLSKSDSNVPTFTVSGLSATGLSLAPGATGTASFTVAAPAGIATGAANVSTLGAAAGGRTSPAAVMATTTVQTVTVTFDSTGGSTVAPVTVNYGTAVSQPDNPVRTGFTFAGWYSDQSLITAYLFTTPVTANLTLFAKWLPVATRTNVALAANGGTAAASSAGSYPAAKVNDGSRVPATSNYWRDTTYNSWPDSATVTLKSLSSISEIDVITTPNDLTSTTEPTAGVTTFTANGITAYDVQYCSDQTAGYTTTCPVSGTGTNWVTLQSVTAADPRLVWRTFTFPAVTTQRIRVVVNASLNYNSRIVEIEAYTP